MLKGKKKASAKKGKAAKAAKATKATPSGKNGKKVVRRVRRAKGALEGSTVREPTSFFAKYVGGEEGQYPKILWWKLWRRVLLSHAQQNSSQWFPERDYNFYGTDRASFSGKDNIAVAISLDGYPTALPLELKTMIRNRLDPGNRLSFISYSSPTTIEWQSPEMRSRMRNYKRMDDEMDDVDVFDYQANINALDRNRWLKESITYLANADTKRGCQMFNYYSYVILTGVRGESFDDDLEMVINLLTNNGLVVNRVTRHLGDFYRSLSPMALGADAKVLNSVGKNVLPDEIISRFVSYDQGKIGNTGIYLARDILSGYDILKTFKKDDTDAENFLILAETGWGKSYAVKMHALQLLANRRIRGTIMDIEGNEYIPLASFMAHNDDVVVLNMAEGQGAYFDPVAVVCSGDEELDMENNMFGLSKSYTLSIFKAIVGEQNIEGKEWCDVILNDAVARTYAEAGVRSNDYRTWPRSHDLSLRDVYDNIKKAHEEAYSGANNEHRAHNEDYRSTLDLVVAMTGRYFEDESHGGLQADTFKNRVSLDKVANAKLVICSFGMKSRASNTVDPIQMALTQLSAANISHIRSLYCKRDGKFNLKIWEELQRWVEFPGSKEILNVAVTGGRKMGDINYIVSNDPRLFLGADARLGIFSNITSFMVGAITDATVRTQIAEALSVPELLPDLTDLVEHAGDVETFNEDSNADNESIFRRAFLIKLDKSVATIGKIKIRSYIADSMLFKTGSVESELPADAPVIISSEDFTQANLISDDFDFARNIGVEDEPEVSHTDHPFSEGYVEDNDDSGFTFDEDDSGFTFEDEDDDDFTFEDSSFDNGGDSDFQLDLGDTDEGNDFDIRLY